MLAGNTFGASVADANGDGWPDVVTGDMDGRYRFLRNRGVVGAGNHRASLQLRATGRNPFGVGSKLRIHLDDGRVLTRWVLAGGGQDLTTTVGLGSSGGATIEVRWPDGSTSTTRVPADVRATLSPSGIVGEPTPLRAP